MSLGSSVSMGAFGNLLKQHRLSAGFTQAELAERAGVSVYSISNLERRVDHVPRLVTVRLLADALGLDGAERAAFLRAAAAPDGSRTAIPLPSSPTPLIGRDGLVEAIITHLRPSQHLGQPPVRLLTLTGSPGVGKTRLALEAAARLQTRFAEGVCFVALAAVVDPNQVDAAVASALGISIGEQPITTALAQALRARELLLLLDNFEHLIPAAPLVADLLAACPSLSVLVTSRAPLHLRAEQVFAAPPLELPDLAELPPVDELAQTPAVALFVARARACAPHFDLTSANSGEVAAICHRLDGLPLALELAAAHTPLLSPRALLTQLSHRLAILAGGPHDLPPRQRTLRAALNWSYDLLTPRARAVFRALGAFRGGASVEAVEAVCGATISPLDTLHLLEEVAAHSLASREPTNPDTSARFAEEGADEPVRISLLETVREYAEERLATAGEAEEERVVRDAHAAWYLNLAEVAAPALQRGADQSAWLARLEHERANLIAAFAWLTQRAEEGDAHAAEAALRLALATTRFWMTRGPLGAGRAWLERGLALTMANESAPKTMSKTTVTKRQPLVALRASALNALGALASDQGDMAAARTALREALWLRRAENDAAGVAATLNNLGLAELTVGDAVSARACFAEALALKRRLGDLGGLTTTLNNLGLARKMTGDYQRAVVTLAAAARRAMVMRDDQSRACALANRADALRLLGRLAEAETAAEESLAVRRALGDLNGMGQVTGILGSLAEERGDIAGALARFREALEYFRAAGAQTGALEALTAIALLCAGRGEHRNAVQLLAAIEATSQALGLAVWDAADQARTAAALEAARIALGEEGYLAARAAGMQVSLAQESLVASAAIAIDVEAFGQG